MTETLVERLEEARIGLDQLERSMVLIPEKMRPDTSNARALIERIDVLLEALTETAASPGSGDGWQPIETAPRDGTEIIIAFIRNGRIQSVTRAKWVTAEFWADLEGGHPDDFVAGWFEPDAEDELCASHWMPLPPPPSKEEDSA